MKFLCLHGMGANSKIFELQTAAIRHQLGDAHTYDFVEGSIPHPPAEGVMSVAGPDDEFFAYTTQLSSESCAFVLDDLESYLEEEGPFDGVWGFSEGACLAAMLLIRQRRRHEERARALGHSAPPPFKPLVRCAVFFSAPTPPDPMALGRVDKEREPLDPKSAGEPIRIPTAHIWGKEDRKFIGSGMTKLCQTDGRRVFIHGRGHEIPNGRDPWSLNATLEAISKTIEAASQSPRGL